LLTTLPEKSRQLYQKSGMNYLAALNRVSSLVKTNKLDAKLRNENYCKTNFGPHATQVIMDAIDSSKMK
jgi:hypothetical protein